MVSTSYAVVKATVILKSTSILMVRQWMTGKLLRDTCNSPSHHVPGKKDEM